MIAALAALIAGTIAYLLYEIPDDSTVGLQSQEQAAQRIRAEIQSIEDLSYQFIANEDLNNILHAYGKRPNKYDGALANLSFSRYLESQRIVSAMLEEAFFIDYDEIDRIPLTMTEDFLRPEITAVRRFVWNRAIDADGVCVWMDDTFSVHGERYVIAARLIKRLRTGEPMGVLVLLTNSGRASGLLEHPKAAKNAALPRELGLIVSNTGMVMAASDDEAIGKSLASVLEGSPDFEEIATRRQESGRFSAQYSNHRANVFYIRIMAKGLYLVSIHADRIGSSVIRRLVVSLLFVLAAVLVVWLGIRSAGVQQTERPAMELSPGFDETLPPGLPQLTSRERQLLMLLARGLSNKEIAGEFLIKEQTVKNYLRPLYDKLGVHDRVSALLKLREYQRHPSPGGSTKVPS